MTQVDVLETPVDVSAALPLMRRHERRRRPLPRVGILLWACGYVAAGYLLMLSYHAAAWNWGRDLEFVFFWSAVLPVYVATAAGASLSTRPWVRFMLLLLLSVFGSLPKLLRTPSGPLYFDELMHWRQTDDLVSSGVIGASNTALPTLSGFPGLHTLTASLAQLSGLPAWTVGVLVVVTCHAATLFGVRSLAVHALDGRVASRVRVPELATVVYATGASWLFFDTQFAYESLALPLFVWALSAAWTALTGPRKGLLPYAAAGTLLSCGVAVTHHATAIALVLILIWLSVIRLLRGGVTAARRLWIPGAMITGVLLWLIPHSADFGDYLGRHFNTALGQVLSAASEPLGGGEEGTHGLFAGTQLPVYEVVSAVLAPLILFMTLWGSRLSRVLLWFRRPVLRPFRRARRRADAVNALRVLLTGLSLLYFATLPLMFTATGNEITRRSWVFTWIGVSFMLGLAISQGIDHASSRVQLGWQGLGSGLLIATMTVGNVAAGENEAYRFPGPWKAGSDARSDDAELRSLTSWFQARVTHGSWITADRYTASYLASLGGQNLVVPWAGAPLWDLPSTSPTPAEVLDAVRKTSVQYLVVDGRMAYQRPDGGFWYDQNEPAVLHDRTASPAALHRFDCLPWSQAVYSSEHYTVYRLDLGRYDLAAERDVTAWLSEHDAQGERRCP